MFWAGFSATCGGCFAVLLLGLAWKLIDRVFPPVKTSIQDFNERSLKALIIRNDLTIDTNREIQRIADLIEEFMEPELAESPCDDGVSGG